MRRRSFLKTLVAAYCTPIVMALAPMLMRPIEVVEAVYREFDVYEIGRWFGLPAHVVDEIDFGTRYNYSGVDYAT